MKHYRKDSHVLSVDIGKIIDYVDKHSPYIGNVAKVSLFARVLRVMDEGFSAIGYRVVKGFPSSIRAENFPNLRSSNHRKMLTIFLDVACGGVK